MTSTTIVGSRARRLDADDKLTGKARYTGDLALPGMLYGKIVRSDRPHARIISIDVSPAEELPGVEAVLYGEVGRPFGEGVKDQNIFATEKVRFVGDPIAAVAAESEAIAELAASLIEVDYEDLPALFDPIEAMKPDAPLIHEDVNAYEKPGYLVRWGNVCAQILLERGDVAGAFASAAKVVEGTYSAHSAHQASMEPRAVLADVDGRGAITLRCSTQNPFGVRNQLHEALGISHADIRVIAETVGGGFGSKGEASIEYYAALLARATGRPVRLANTREEDLAFGNPRHPMRIKLRTALDADGTILGREARATLDAGAYCGGSHALAGLAALLIPGPYRIPNLKVEVLAVHTNKVSFGAYRGPTGPQAVFAVESHTDAIAREIGIDAVEFRLKNVFRDGDSGHTGQHLSNVSLSETVEKAAEAIGWNKPGEPSSSGLKRGKGISCGWWLTGDGSAGCSVQLNEDGTVVVQTGATEIGSGSVMSAIPQIVAEELGVRYEDVRVVWGDTAATPLDAGALGSRTLFNMGRAAQRAAIEARTELLRRAADVLEASEADLDVHDGKITIRGVPDRSLTYTDLASSQMWTSEPVLGRGTYRMEPTPFDPTTISGTTFGVFNAASFHCHAAEVEVDPETGKTTVVDFVVAQDAGFAVNPTLVEGQIQGGAVQGIGYALLEELVFEEGRIANPNLALYKLPTTLDVPNVRTVIVESASEDGPYGAKGVGEPPIVMSTAAVANAITSAIEIPIQTMPLSAERVFRAIRNRADAPLPFDDEAFGKNLGIATGGPEHIA